MDTQNLSAFIQVAESSSFSIAAEKLFLTQPAVSKRIAALEEQLDTKLFDRINRTVALTEAGKILLPRAKAILQTLQETRQALVDLQGDVSGTLNLATSHHIGLHHLPPVLRAFTQQYPKVALDLSFLDSEKAYAEVAHGNIELAMITLSPQPQSQPAVLSQVVWQDPLQFVVSPLHPLAAQQQVSLSDLAGYPAILPTQNTYTTQIVKQLFDAQGLTLELKMATNFLETIKMMVSINLGWSVLPVTLIDADLQVLALPNVKLQRQLGVIYHHNRRLSNAAQAFIASLNPKPALTG